MTGFQSKRAMNSVPMMQAKKKKHRFWTEQTDLYGPINRAYLDWFHSPVVGTKYVWFEHHAEILLGFKCQIDFNGNKITDINVVDPKKYLMFLLKYSHE